MKISTGQNITRQFRTQVPDQENRFATYVTANKFRLFIRFYTFFLLERELSKLLAIHTTSQLEMLSLRLRGTHMGLVTKPWPIGKKQECWLCTLNRIFEVEMTYLHFPPYTFYWLDMINSLDARDRSHVLKITKPSCLQLWTALWERINFFLIWVIVFSHLCDSRSNVALL